MTTLAVDWTATDKKPNIGHASNSEGSVGKGAPCCSTVAQAHGDDFDGIVRVGPMAVEALVFLLEGFLQSMQQFRCQLHALDGEPNLGCLTEKSDVHVAGGNPSFSRGLAMQS